jgi:iron complex outermembrane receptor protein
MEDPGCGSDDGVKMAGSPRPTQRVRCEADGVPCGLRGTQASTKTLDDASSLGASPVAAGRSAGHIRPRIADTNPEEDGMRSAWSSVVPAVLGLLAVASSVAAQARDTTRADTTIFRIGEIIVQAARPVTTVGGASAIEVQLDSLSLRPAPTLEQVLREIPAIHVRTNARGEAEITVRGSESRQVAVLVDGVPLTLGWDSRTDVSVIPATAARELTLIRGLSSVLYGPNTLGGIIEVGVGSAGFAREPRSLQLTAGFDHVGGYGTSATVSQPLESSGGRWLVRAGAGYRGTPGSPLADGVTEPVPGDDDDLRLNTDVEHVDGFFSARYSAAAGAWASLSASGYRAKRGIAAELGVAEPRLWRYPNLARGVAVVSGGTGMVQTPFGGRGDLEASLGIDIGGSDIDSYDSRSYRNVVEEEDGDDRTYTLRLLGDHTLGGRGDLRGAFTYVDIHHDERLTGEPEARYRQRLWSAGAETVWRLVDAPASRLSNLRLSFGGVLDMADTPESGGRPSLGRLADWGARLGVTAGIAGGDALLHAGVSRRARFPALRELYSGALGRFEPNPDLTPERLVAAETGITTRVGAGELQAVVFHHRLSDAVVRIVTDEGRFRRVNRNQIRSTGVELLASGHLGPLSLAADLTLQSVDLIDPSTDTSNQPENQPSAYGSVHGRVTLPLQLRAGAEARFTGDQFCVDPDTGADRELEAGTRFNADLSREWRIRPSGAPWLSRLEAGLAVDNIGDRAIFDQCGLPQPGRLIRVQIRLF